MNVLEHLGGGPGMFRFQIDYLASNHAVYRAGPASNLLDDLHARLGRTLQARQHIISLDLQGVAGENRYGLAAYFVASCAPAEQAIGVESRKIVVSAGLAPQH